MHTSTHAQLHLGRVLRRWCVVKCGQQHRYIYWTRERRLQQQHQRGNRSSGNSNSSRRGSWCIVGTRAGKQSATWLATDATGETMADLVDDNRWQIRADWEIANSGRACPPPWPSRHGPLERSPWIRIVYPDSIKSRRCFCWAPREALKYRLNKAELLLLITDQLTSAAISNAASN